MYGAENLKVKRASEDQDTIITITHIESVEAAMQDGQAYQIGLSRTINGNTSSSW